MAGVPLERAAAVRLLVLDVDGVLTDGRLLFSSDGSEIKAFHTRDGHGIKLLREAGIEVAVISGRRSPAVERRMAELGVEMLFQGHEDKLAVFDSLLARLQIEPERTACVGDDTLDLPLMRRAGLAVAVRDAHPRVREEAHWVTAAAGGAGAVREVCDLLLRARAVTADAEGTQ